MFCVFTIVKRRDSFIHPFKPIKQFLINWDFKQKLRYNIPRILNSSLYIKKLGIWLPYNMTIY